MKKLMLMVAGAALVLTAVAAARPVAPHPAVATKKRCRTIVKKVHGKKRKVRVCRTIKKPPPPPPPGAHLVATVRLNIAADDLRPPRWIAADATNVWVHTRTALLRVDAATNAVVARIPTPEIEFGYTTAGAGAVWQADFGDDALLRIDPATNRAAIIPLLVGAAPEGVAVAAGSVWVANHHLGSVSRIDPTTGYVTATISVGPPGDNGPLELAAGLAGVWVNVPNAGAVVHIDPATNSVAGSVDEIGPPIVDGDSVWVERPFSLDRVDPATHKIVAKVPLQEVAGWGTAAFGSVWVFDKRGLARIDEQTNKLVGLLKGAPFSETIAATADAIWTFDGADGGRLLRYAPD